MKIGLLKQLRAYARKKIYIERRFAGVRQPPCHVVCDIEYHRNTGDHGCPTYEDAVKVLYRWRDELVERKAYHIRMDRQRKHDNKILDI